MIPEAPGRGSPGRGRNRPVEVALAIPLREGRCLIARRPEGTHLGGSWEFPGGKIRAGESPPEAALRELAEETGLRGRTVESLAVVVHAYSDRTVRLHCFLVRDARGDAGRSALGRTLRWARPDEIDERCMPEANGPVLRALRGRVG